jgi:anaerobic nitric oxide reductase flavorubredoxin
MVNYKRIFNRHGAYFGSYGWGGGATRYLKTQFEKLKWELVESLEFPGQPTQTDLASARIFSERFGILIKNL